MTEPIMLPYQARWLADKSPVKVWEKSRRIGASWCTACEADLIAATEGGENVWYIGYNQDMAQEFVDDAITWARHLNLAASRVDEVVIEDERGDILMYEIRFASGNRVKALTSRPTNLRAKGGVAVIDEAAFHDDFPALMKAALAFLMWGGRVFILSTHFGADNPFNELVIAIREKRKNFSLHRTTIDDAIEEGLYRRICLMQGNEWTAEGEQKWREEIIGQYGDDAGEELYCNPAGHREGALWSRDTITRGRVVTAPALERVIVGVDPMGSAKSKDAETGIVAAGRSGEHFYVLEDASVSGRPHVWGSEAVAVYQARLADGIAAEINYGGDMVEGTIKFIDRNAKVIQVRASRGKLVRAEPIAALYDEGRVHHVGTFPALEREMCRYNGTGKSPNRMDALVWALAELSGGMDVIERLRALTSGARRGRS